MKLNWIDQLGNWNPQLMRELKGRLKPRNVLIAGAISLLGQFLLFVSFQNQLPNLSTEDKWTRSRYCIGEDNHYHYFHECIRDRLGNVLIDWHLWWLDLFVTLSLVGIFTLLVAGSYLLISDLATEQRRDTLNFIRLSPESTQNILIGKLLGVPILLYFIAFLTTPLHLWAGLSAQIPLGEILGFWAVLAASCLLFYSFALLYGLGSTWLGGFQVWLGSGVILALLALMITCRNSTHVNNPLTWLVLLCDFELIPDLYPNLAKLQWFSLPLGANIASLFSFAIVNFGIWIYWLWQGLGRCFRQPNATILSKRQSYLMTACFEITILGFAVPGWAAESGISSGRALVENLGLLSLLNLFLFLFLIAALSPHRQVLQDWARYRREHSRQRDVWSPAVMQELIWSEKSPALVAIALNLLISIIPVVGWISLLPATGTDKIKALFALACFAGVMMIYAVLTQLMLLMKTSNRVFWATGVLGAAIFLPPVILGLLQLNPEKNPVLWLFSACPLIGMQYAATTPACLAILSQWGILVLLNLRLTQQLKKAGESASKALFAGHPEI